MNNLNSFIAINDKRPGQNTFKVFGTLIMSDSATHPVLVEPTVRHKGGWEVLTLEFQRLGGVGLTVLTERGVHFERAGGTAWEVVEIIHPDGTSHKLKIHTID